MRLLVLGMASVILASPFIYIKSHNLTLDEQQIVMMELFAAVLPLFIAGVFMVTLYDRLIDLIMNCFE